MKSSACLLMCGVVLGFAAVALAQKPAADPARASQPGQDAQHAAVSEQQLAMLLALGNQAEIDLAKLALSKSQNPDVQGFARKMNEDHSKYLEKLNRFTSASPTAGQATQRSTTGTAPGATTQTTGVQRPESLADIVTHVCKLNLELTMQLLDVREGKGFDQCYMGQQVGAHVQMLAELTAVKNCGSAEFQQLVVEGIKTTHEHLQQAQQIVKKLES